MLCQNRSFDDLTSIQPWFIAGMLHTKVPTPKKARRSTDRQPLDIRPLKNFLHVSVSISLLQEKYTFSSVKCRFFLTKPFFLNLDEIAVLPKWQPEAMTSTDVENSNNKYGFKVSLVEGNSLTELHRQFAVSSLYYPISLQPCSGLNNPDLMDNIARARKRQTSSNSRPSPDHFDSCSVPARLHLLK